jgi:hypothetical protein
VNAPDTIAPAMVLGCIVDRPAARQPTEEWREALAPEVTLRVVEPDTFSIASGGLPYALLAIGGVGARAARLTRSLLAGGDGPAHLLMCGGVDPAPLPVPPACRLTVFAETWELDTAAGWGASREGEFTLRVLRDPVAVPPFGPVSPDLALALKEELGVWPF